MKRPGIAKRIAVIPIPISRSSAPSSLLAWNMRPMNKFMSATSGLFDDSAPLEGSEWIGSFNGELP
jgi:hypothetical protein